MKQNDIFVAVALGLMRHGAESFETAPLLLASSGRLNIQPFSKVSMYALGDAASPSAQSSAAAAAGQGPVNSLRRRRVGIGQNMLNWALQSPLWEHVLVPQARQTIQRTATANGIAWESCKAWLCAQEGPWQHDIQYDVAHVPVYYYRPFHAYSNGNLCWEAALEVELAAAAVGARNFPNYGAQGEAVFRDSFGIALDEIGARVSESDSTILDLGCGTGMSTRWLARRYPQAARIVGMDLSPYFVEVGKRLLELAPLRKEKGTGNWVSDIQYDARVTYQVGDATATGLPNNSVDVVNLLFVAHEMPADVACQVVREAHRVLKPGGQLHFCEMDFATPGYAAQRANALLFSLIRATEPYLDDYADGADAIFDCLRDTFDVTTVAAATGRHFAIVAQKEAVATRPRHELHDLRWDENGNYRVEDTHLKVWESKA